MAVYQAIQIAGSVFLGLVFVTGMCGNYLVASAVLTVSNLHTAAYFILVNLALADILGCLANLPIMITTFVMDLRLGVLKPLSDVNFVFSVSLGTVVICCHILLCIDRHDSIASPFNRRITTNRMRKISVGVWSIFFGVVIASTILVLLLDTHWLLIGDEEPHFVAGEVINGAGITVVGLTLFTMLYTFITLKVNMKRHRIHMLELNQSNMNQRARLLREARLLKVAFIVVLSFALMTFPWIVERLLYSITGHDKKEVFIVCYSILYSSHAINPLVYASIMPNLRREMKVRALRAIRCVCAFCRKSGVSPNGS